MGVIDGNKNSKKEHNDSFEKYYNKDLDLDEGKQASFWIFWFFAA